ncbi:hypothetical protein SCP_0706200 [Sparassis crispa]|uniref:Uncharacterized protein n=1 Tax=Sparassis crispa TaxID=139825 RepID=A0A401GTC9_9APHY|nr:hypothetical protein SCP_0706200 [Sparassis crispa]GBE85433.1 hypothetical protein SCP_0706200 [Sparassis crispa]
MWRTVVEEGLFRNSPFLERIEHKLSRFRSEAGELRTETHRATTFLLQLKGIITGLSLQIAYLCEEVNQLRATISTTTTEERKKLRNERRYVPTGQVSITNPASMIAVSQSSVDEVAHSSPVSAYHTETTGDTDRSLRSEYTPEAPSEDGSTLSHCDNTSTALHTKFSTLTNSNTGDADSKHRSADVNAEEAGTDTLKNDSSAVCPPLYISSEPGGGIAPQKHPLPFDATLYHILRRIHHDLNAKGHSHPLLPAVAEYARAPHCVELEPLFRRYEAVTSTTPSGSLEVQTTRE